MTHNSDRIRDRCLDRCRYHNPSKHHSARPCSAPLCSLTFAVVLCPRAIADDTLADIASATNAPTAGHSLHGEAFNEGPRQAAKLIPGTGKVKLKISGARPKAQAFFNQGVGQ